MEFHLKKKRNQLLLLLYLLNQLHHQWRQVLLLVPIINLIPQLQPPLSLEEVMVMRLHKSSQVHLPLFLKKTQFFHLPYLTILSKYQLNLQGCSISHHWCHSHLNQCCSSAKPPLVNLQEDYLSPLKQRHHSIHRPRSNRRALLPPTPTLGQASSLSHKETFSPTQV